MAADECLAYARATSSTALATAPSPQSALVRPSDPLGDARDVFELQRLFKQRLAEASGKVALVMQNVHDVQSRLGEQDSRLSALTQNLESSQDRSEQADLLQASPRLRVESGDALHDASGPEEEISRSAASPDSPRPLLASSSSLEEAGRCAESPLTYSGTEALLALAAAGSDEGPAIRPELREMCGALVEEFQHIYELAARGEQATREVEQARVDVEGLCAATAARSLQTAAATLDPQVAQFFQNLRLELNHALSELRTQVLNLEHRFNEYVTGQVVEMRQDTAELMSAAVQGIREDALQALAEEPSTLRLTDRANIENELATIVATVEQLMDGQRQELAGALEELRGSFSQLTDRCDQVSRDAAEARRGLDAFHEEFAPLQAVKPVTQQELDKNAEFLSQEFKLMLDMTMHSYHTAARQEIAQARSELRRELRPLADFGASESATATRRDVAEAVDQLRSELAPTRKEKNGDQAATHRELMEAMESIMEEVRAEIASNCDKTASQHGDTRRSLATLIEDVGILKARGKLLGEEADSDKAMLEQRLHTLHQEHKEGLASLRAEVTSVHGAFASKALSAGDGADASAQLPMEGRVPEELAREVADTRRDLNGLQDELLSFTKLLNRDMTQLALQASKCDQAVTKQEFSEMTRSFRQELKQLAEKVSGAEACPGKASPTSTELNCDCEELSILHTSKWVSQPQLTTAIEQLRDELSGTAGAEMITRQELTSRLENLHDEFLAVAGVGLQSQPRSDAVSRQELVEIVDFLKEEIPRRATEAASLEVARSRKSDGSTVESSTAELAAAHRSLESLRGDMSSLKAWQVAFRDEAAKEREALEQRFRLVRQEHALKIEELRAELPRSGPETERPALRNEGFRENHTVDLASSDRGVGSNAAELTASAAAGATVQREAADPPNKDFGTLRQDLTALKSRQEFLKNELKSLVDSASRGVQQPVKTSPEASQSPASVLRSFTSPASSRKEFAKNP